MKSFLTISTCFVMILTVCGLVTAADKDKKTPEPATSDVAVTVNGIDITETQLEIAIAPQLQKVSAQLPPQFIEQFKAQMKQQALEKMIVEQLLDETVKAEKIIITDKEVDTQIEEMAAKEGLARVGAAGGYEGQPFGEGSRWILVFRKNAKDDPV